MELSLTLLQILDVGSQTIYVLRAVSLLTTRMLPTGNIDTVSQGACGRAALRQVRSKRTARSPKDLPETQHLFENSRAVSGGVPGICRI